jgi:hypothetical protein
MVMPAAAMPGTQLPLSVTPLPSGPAVLMMNGQQYVPVVGTSGPQGVGPALYYPPQGSGPGVALPDPVPHEGEVIEGPPEAGANGQGGQRWISHLNQGGGCGCGGDGNGGPIRRYMIQPVRHVLLCDCWANHDEYGCDSFWGEVRFAFGSCRAYFGETCERARKEVPVPPGYSLVPGPRSGALIPVPPNVPPQLTPGTKN